MPWKFLIIQPYNLAFINTWSYFAWKNDCTHYWLTNEPTPFLVDTTSIRAKVERNWRKIGNYFFCLLQSRHTKLKQIVIFQFSSHYWNGHSMLKDLFFPTILYYRELKILRDISTDMYALNTCSFYQTSHQNTW